MRRGTWILVAAACATVLGILTVSHTVSAPGKKPPPSSPIYNPYPPDVLPPDLESEIERVRREVNGIFEEALGEWRALPPPTLTGQPPTLQGTGYQAVQIYARRFSVLRHVRKLPGGNDGKGGLLAHARGPEQHRHDGR